ncbi:MAG: low specificity L-threonine aldolase [Pedosphaera sp.]|nr:low specificity L-threonine aldolase [Pedosphaera sp.]
MQRHFASDNNAGICPEAWAALAEANAGHAPGYGEDEWTARAADAIRHALDSDGEVFFLFNGTAANALALAHLCEPFHSVLCQKWAHAEMDECGAPGFFSGGAKLVLLPGADAKIQPEDIAAAVHHGRELHAPKVRALTLTQSTELGTVYSPREISAITKEARRHGLRVHMDGARLANAVASLGVAPSEVTWRAGVDVLTFGLTKVGSHAGEAVVFFDRALAREFDYRCKQAGQLASKMRFLAAPWVELLRDGAWLRHAEHANKMAERLRVGLASMRGVKVLLPRQANAVFVDLPKAVIDALHAAGWHFYTFIGETGCRLMCAWDTEPADVDRFLEETRRILSHSKRKRVRSK